MSAEKTEEAAEDETTSILEEARTALQEGRRIYDGNLNWRLHDLAEAGDEKAKTFFLEVIQTANNGSWRLEAIRDVGFHYDLGSDPAAVEIIRKVLPTDTWCMVRMAAASILGIRSSWPDYALYQALTTDQDEFVQSAAFESLLKLSGMSHSECRDIMAQVEAGVLSVTSDSLKSLVGKKFYDLVRNR